VTGTVSLGELGGRVGPKQWGNLAASFAPLGKVTMSASYGRQGLKVDPVDLKGGGELFAGFEVAGRRLGFKGTCELSASAASACKVEGTAASGQKEASISVGGDVTADTPIAPAVKAGLTVHVVQILTSLANSAFEWMKPGIDILTGQPGALQSAPR
jgi:hypothetical protein